MLSLLNERFSSLIIRQFGDADPLFLIDLMQSAQDGHLCIKRPTTPMIPSTSLYDASIGTSLFPLEPIVRLGDRYYLQRNWVYETYICKEISRLTSSKVHTLSSEHSTLIQEAYLRGELTASQARAVEKALTHQLTVISGGPGTGKTYTAAQIIRILAQISDVNPLYRVYLTAPTGRAAQHLRSGLAFLQSPIEIKVDTLHRMLGLTPGKSKLFASQPIQADIVIVDEASMIDVDLWAHLLEAIQGSTKLVVMGDPDQLPPVEAGSIFSDLSDLFAVRLDRCMRTDRKQLQELSLAIQQADEEAVLKNLQEGCGIFGPIDLKRLYEELSMTLFPSEPDPFECLCHFQKVKILGTLRQGPLGVDRLNSMFLEFYTNTFRKGFFWAIPILICVNAPHIGLYNGSFGVLIGACQHTFEPREGTAYFLDSLSGEIRSFSPNILPRYEWAFCLSVHKSQGSEFDHVVALFPEGSERFGREALYTAATRSKKSLAMAIDPHVLKFMLNQHSRKESGIVERLKTSAI